MPLSQLEERQVFKLSMGSWFELDVGTGCRTVYLRAGARDWWIGPK